MGSSVLFAGIAEARRKGEAGPGEERWETLLVSTRFFPPPAVCLYLQLMKILLISLQNHNDECSYPTRGTSEVTLTHLHPVDLTKARHDQALHPCLAGFGTLFCFPSALVFLLPSISPMHASESLPQALAATQTTLISGWQIISRP